jgi:DNA helicase IV
VSDFSDRLVDPVEPAQPIEADGIRVAELDLDRPDEIAQRGATVRQLAVDERVWRFGHVIVDEAQDLTPMQWRMIVRRSQAGAVTMLGDLAQRSIGPPGAWADHLPPELSDFEQQNLTTNYRSPAEINELASAVLAELVPGLPPSAAVRFSGHQPAVVTVSDLEGELPAVVATMAERSGRPPAVIGFDLPPIEAGRPWAPARAKGLEFDDVVVVEPARFLDHENGLSLLYVALTRATSRLVVVNERPLPEVLGSALARLEDASDRAR